MGQWQRFARGYYGPDCQIEAPEEPSRVGRSEKSVSISFRRWIVMLIRRIGGGLIACGTTVFRYCLVNDKGRYMNA